VTRIGLRKTPTPNVQTDSSVTALERAYRLYHPANNNAIHFAREQPG
jgi:hypothetical protein